MTDEYKSNVVLLLPLCGANGGTTFTDFSPTPKTVNRAGNTITKTDSYKFYGSSGFFDGSGDYLSLADSDDFHFGSGDFTLEAWIRPQSSSTVLQGIIAQRYQSSSNHSFSFWTQNSGTLAFEANNNSFTCYSNAGVVPLDAWSHVAACRSGNTLRLFVNGLVVKEQAITATLNNYSQVIQVGRASSSLTNGDYKGHISDLRVTKGVARYTGTFTPPGQLLIVEVNLAASLSGDDSLLSAAVTTHVAGAVTTAMSSDEATFEAWATPAGIAEGRLGDDVASFAARIAWDLSWVGVFLPGHHDLSWAPRDGRLKGDSAALLARVGVSATIAASLTGLQASVTGASFTPVSAAHQAAWRVRLETALSASWSIPLRPPRHALAWGDLAVARASRVHQWDDCLAPGLTHTASWGDTAAPGLAHTASWSDAAAPRASLDAPWGNVATVAPEHVAFWADGQAPRTSLAVPWSDRAQARFEHALPWGNGVFPRADLTASWAEVGAPRRSNVAPWADTASALRAHTLAWADAVELRVSLAHPWSDRAQARDALVSPWQDGVPLSSAPLVVSWSDRAQAERAVETIWSDAVPGRRTHGLAWGDHPVALATHAAVYADRAHGTQAVMATWDDAVPARGESVGSWANALPARRAVSCGWGNQASAGRAHQSGWGLCPVARATHAAAYADREATASAHAAAWSGQSGVSATFAGSWSLTATGRKAHAATWGLASRPAARADLQGRWALLEALHLLSIDNVPEVVWQGRAVPIHAARLSADEDSPVWIAEEIVVADQALWGEIQLGDQIQFSITNESWTLRVDGKGMSRPQVGELRLALSAVSPLAWLDAPYAAAITLDNSEGPVSAQATVAALVAAVGVLRWELDDWLIPAGALAMSETTPLQAAREIIAALGGLLESDPDGTPVARPRHPVTVPDYAVAIPDHSILDADLFAFQVSAAPSSGFNRVVISNDDLSGSEVGDRLEYLDEDDNRYDGEMRAWPHPWRPVTLGHTGHPETEIEALGERSHAHTELVEFVAGQGRTEYPVQAITSLTWQHADLGSVSASGTTLTAASAGQSLAWVTYTSLSLDWRVALARDEAVQFVLI